MFCVYNHNFDNLELFLGSIEDNYLIKKKHYGIEKNRSGKTSRGQYEFYLNELESNKDFRENKFDGADPDIIKRSWADLALRLNASGGPIRDVAGWKRIMSDWKCQTRGKDRKNRHLLLETGNIGDPPKPLTDLEERLLDLTGRVVVDGMEEIPEYGIAEQFPINKENVPQSTNTVAGPSQKKVQDKPDTPVKKKRRSLTACLQEIITPIPDTNNSEVLREIRDELKKSNKIQKKRLKLQQLELQVKYPEYNFISSSDSE